MLKASGGSFSTWEADHHSHRPRKVAQATAFNYHDAYMYCTPRRRHIEHSQGH